MPVVELPVEASRENRLLAAREQLIARLTAEIRPERRSILSRGELAKIVDAAVQAYLPRHGVEANALERRDLITALMQALLTPPAPDGDPDAAVSQRRSKRAAIGAAKEQIQPLVLEHMDIAAAAEMPRATFETQLDGWVKQLLGEAKIQLNFIEQRELVQSLIADMLGLGPLDPLIEDETVTDIMVNGAKQVYVERRGKLELTDVSFRDDQHVMNVATKIVTRIGRRVDESRPLVDARLADGSRVNIIIPPLAIDGPSISIRKFSKKTITLDTMAQQANISPEMATVLKIAARCRRNVLISGGTGSGQDDLAQCTVGLYRQSPERVVTIEDSAELQLQQPHVCRLETRPPNIEAKGEVTQRDLVRNSLRMRPDRIILGEVRAGEAFDMLQAMNTGHDGLMTTSPCQQSTGCADPARKHGRDDRDQPALARGAHPDRRGRPHDPSGQPDARRHAPHHRHHRGGRDGGRHHHHPGAVQLSVSGRSRGRPAARRIQVERGAPALSATRRILWSRPPAARDHLMAYALGYPSFELLRSSFAR